jgi:hypothetical protein
MQRKIAKTFACAFAFSSLLTLQMTYAQADNTASEFTADQIMSQDSDTYTEEISSLATKAKSILDAGLNEFSEETLPHQAKDLRKQIVRLRDILDIFSHNFSHELSLWDDLRDGLDDGYTVVGDFKDLFDTMPRAAETLASGNMPEYEDKNKLNERRNKVLKWKESYFTENGLSDKLKLLLSQIRPLAGDNVVYSKKYSDFFWGGVTTMPMAGNTPAQNARLLVNSQSSLAIGEHSSVLDIKNPSSHKNELIFHDHRKRLRTITKVCNVANAISENTCNTEAVKEIEDLVVELGEIEDLIITGRHLDEDGKKSKAEKAYEDSRKKFKKLKKKFEGKNMLEPLSFL